jgi:hypothetical protein
MTLSRKMLRISREENRKGALRARFQDGFRSVAAPIRVGEQRGKAALPAGGRAQ